MKKTSTLALSLGLICLAPALVSAQIFSEGFSGSTVMSPSPVAPPTATSTDYAVLSSKNATGSSLLNLTISDTSSGFGEMQALFTTSPVMLSAGEYIQLQMSFQVSGLMDVDGATESLNVGLYNGGQSYPVPGGGMANGGMSSSGTSYVNGYAQNWVGYVGRLGVPNGSNGSQIFTRPAQTDTVDENQDVLFNNAGGGAFDTPTGTTLVSGDQILLGQAQDYTITLNISYDGTDVTVVHNLFEGVGTGGANLVSMTGMDSGGVTTYDALAFGFRGAGTGLNWTINSLDITTGAVPEPATFALFGLGGLALAFARRRA